MITTTNDVLVMLITGTIVVLMMALFGVGFILYYHRRQREIVREKRLMQENYQRELLLSQLEIQNNTLQQVAHELHDNIGQLLTVAVMRLNTLEDELDQPGAQHTVQQIRELIRTVITDVRSLSKTLDFDTVQRFGLLPSLTFELDRIQRVARVHTQLVTTGDVYSMGEQAETVLLRMAQESLNNALKHAQASQLTISVDYQPETFRLVIADDGRGFSIPDVASRSIDQAGAGLSNLNRRAGLLGGTCTVASQPDLGTRVDIVLPRVKG
ncbi:sensor histidine kinase [Spirosoma rigui]|uniref:sensor histidine kinase n=1 Tax=Spirosoma rigui TaxID=564064 RepID=UPI0009B114D0|nr:ATP-binding protein [Spirosoma rigui]